MSELSRGIALIVIPSLAFFLLLPFFLKIGWPFFGALGAACLGLVGVYWIYVKALSVVGIQI